MQKPTYVRCMRVLAINLAPVQFLVELPGVFYMPRPTTVNTGGGTDTKNKVSTDSWTPGEENSPTAPTGIRNLQTFRSRPAALNHWAVPTPQRDPFAHVYTQGDLNSIIEKDLLSWKVMDPFCTCVSKCSLYTFYNNPAPF